MYSIKEILGLNLKNLRKKQKITQQNLSVQVGINYRQLSKIESGSHFPSFQTLEKICLALNIVPYELFICPMINNSSDYESELLLSDEICKNIPEQGLTQDTLNQEYLSQKNYVDKKLCPKGLNPKLRELLKNAAKDPEHIHFIEKVICAIKNEESLYELINCIDEMLAQKNSES